MNTEQLRRAALSASGIGSPLPAPDGSVDNADRYTLLGAYPYVAGVTSGVPSVRMDFVTVSAGKA